MISTKPIFSDDREECLQHYGVKGMKWHRHLKDRVNFLKDMDEARQEWADDKGMHKVIGLTKSAVRAANRHRLGSFRGYVKEHARIAGLHILGAKHQRDKGMKRVMSMFKGKK